MEGEVGATVKVDSSIDVFSLGCCFFFGLTGRHLFTDNCSEYSYLENISEKWKIPLAKNVIETMVHNKSSNRPTTKQILEHPFFWGSVKVLRFFENANDFLQGHQKSDVFEQFKHGELFFSANWRDQVHPALLGRKEYNGFVATDLIRAIRNRV